jgi:hypothetical protein
VEVILYSSGVGYYQRAGEVEGNARTELRFRVEDINDLLKSMVVQDYDGGKISAVTYESRDPVERTLRSFGVDLTSNPSLGRLLIQLRGEPVEISIPNQVSGTILSVETKVQAGGDGKPVETEYLNLLTPQGVVSLPLLQIRRLRLLNSRLNQELSQALEVLASSHDNQKKTVAVGFDGEGKRRVNIAYIAQAPVWKTSYRLVLDEKEASFLQGWAIVENTSDEDWTNVRLALISGRPVSFTMDLYEPLYAQRPEVQMERYLSLRPQVYSEAMDFYFKEEVGRAAAVAESRPAVTAGDSIAGRSAVPLQRQRGLRRAGRGESLGEGIALPGLEANMESLGVPISRDLAAAAHGESAGELFQYVIRTPISLARRSSAMLPIVSENVEGTKVSIYNERVQAKHPLNGFRLKNTTVLHLMQGPVTVFDGNAYAGDARIEDVAPGQERLLSYALDLTTEVEPQQGHGEQKLVRLSIRKGTLVTVRKAARGRSYQARNRDDKEKRLLIEHPFESDWKLVEPREPDERTRDVYRFAVSLKPDEKKVLTVREEKQLSEQVQLTNFDDDTLGFYARSTEASPEVKAALERVVVLRNRLNQTTAEKNRKEQRTNEISQEQARIRENMQRLNQSSELYGRYVRKLDEQETELETLRREIELLKDLETRHRQALNEFLVGLDVE